jgi:hypothetical protein
VLIVEALATTARDTANELLGRLDWQDDHDRAWRRARGQARS